MPRECVVQAAEEGRLEEFLAEQNAEVIAKTMPRIAVSGRFFGKDSSRHA